MIIHDHSVSHPMLERAPDEMLVRGLVGPASVAVTNIPGTDYSVAQSVPLENPHLFEKMGIMVFHRSFS